MMRNGDAHDSHDDTENTYHPVSKRSVITEGAVDSHFHLDRLCIKLGEAEYNFGHLLTVLKPYRPEDCVSVGGAVANFCDPVNYPDLEQVTSLQAQGVESAIGLHPKHASLTGPAAIARFQGLVGLPEVCGFGEVGLDHTVPVEEWVRQRDVLDEILQFLEPRHVLVLHCRPKVARETSELLASLMYQCTGIVPGNQRIHLHCFTGTREDVSRWTKRFPNICFGFTAMVASFNEEQRDALRTLPSEKLLLETDAPYFPLPGHGLSSPSFLGMTASLLAEIRGVSREEILRITAENARRLYWR